MATPAISLPDFLDQFESVDVRWEGYYENETFALLKKCARFQACLVSRSSLGPTRGSDDSHLIASSLRILVLTHEFSLVKEVCPSKASFNREIQLSMERLCDLDPAIEVTRLVKTKQAASSAFPPEDKETLAVMLIDLVQTMQNILFRRKPKEWPSVLCSICILNLAASNIHSRSSMGSELSECSRAIEVVVNTLCGMFDVCSKGIHPLSDSWKKEVYARSVEYDSDLIECFEWFADQWQKGEWISHVSFRAIQAKILIPNAAQNLEEYKNTERPGIRARIYCLTERVGCYSVVRRRYINWVW